MHCSVRLSVGVCFPIDMLYLVCKACKRKVLPFGEPGKAKVSRGVEFERNAA